MKSYIITYIYEIDPAITTVTTFGGKSNTSIIISATVYTELKGAYRELPWTVFGRRALKGKTEKISIYGFDEESIQFSDKSKTTLFNIRAEYHWDLDWSTVIDIRTLNLSTSGERDFGLALEIDRTMAKNTQVGLGYVLSSFDDIDFSFQNYSYSNIYITLNMKFSEDIFNWR